jgi:hypothetical protein
VGRDDAAVRRGTELRAAGRATRTAVRRTGGAISPAAWLRHLEARRAEFGARAAAEKREALDRLARVRLSTAGEVLRLHDALCFLRAYPDDAALLARVTRLLAAFDQRADLRAHRRALENSGIAGTTTRFRFFHPTVEWLSERWPGRLRVDWDEFEHADRLETFFPLIAARAELPGVDEFEMPVRERVARMSGARATDAEFLAAGFRRAFPESEVREAMWDEMDPPLVLEPGDDTPARTRERLAAGPRAFQHAPLSRERPDLAAELARPPLAVRALGLGAGRRVVDLARACMVTRSRDLDAFSYGSAADVRMVDCGDGLTFACIGVVPQRRLLLEAVYAFLTLKNGVPIGYVLSSALYGSAEVAFNVFETWRGAEAGRVYGRAFAMIAHLFGADSFTIFPYQLGEGNDEAIESGAWWFYQKVGFRPRDRGALRLMNAELARMKRRPAHRSTPATLRRLAAHNVYWHAGPPRDDVIGLIPLASVGLQTTKLIAGRFGADRTRAERECSREASALLGCDPRRFSAGERAAWTAWCPVVLALTGLDTWSAGERAALVDVIRAKGGRRESDFVAAFDAHAKLRVALRALAERPTD